MTLTPYDERSKMANKTVVLKDSAGNSIYPNAVKENLSASAVFYGDEGAAGANGIAKVDNCYGGVNNYEQI